MFDEVDRFKREGVAASYLDKVRENRRRRFETDRERNGWWQRRLAEAYAYGDDPRDIIAIEKTLARVNADAVLAAAQVFLDTERTLVGVLVPAPATPASGSAAAAGTN